MDFIITFFPLIVATGILFLSIYLRSEHGNREKANIHAPLDEIYSEDFNVGTISLREEVEIARARSLWIIAAVVFISVSICMILLAGYILWNYSWFSEIHIVLRVILAGIAVTFCVFVYKQDWTGAGGKGLLAAIDRCEEKHVTLFVKKLNLLAGFSAMLMVLACCALMRTINVQSAADMRDILFLFKISLYTSTSFFLTGQLEIYALFKWAGRWVESTADEPDVDFSGMGDSLTIETGLLFSVLLLAVFLPVSLRHQAWINQGYLQDGLVKLGVEKAPIAEFGNYIVCMSPLIVGFTSNLTSWASKLSKWTKD